MIPFCPKCEKEELKEMPSYFFLPTAMPSKQINALAEVKAGKGIMVQAFLCPSCNYIEFYLVPRKKI